MFRPLKSMLASPVADEDEVLKRLGSPVWVEDKYDGIRAQLHKSGNEVRLFSRDLNDISDGYPEVVATAQSQPWDGILDGEVLAFRDGMALPFIQLQQRLGRKNPSQEMQQQVPVIYVAFDLLAHGSGNEARVEPTLTLPLRERRALLDSLRLPDVPGMATGNLLTASTAQELSDVFDQAQERGNEGLMAKDPDSTYTPGRRGYGWLKLKRPLATLDCVVVGVEVGHGKRHGVLSDYTFAVRDDREGSGDRLVTIGKAYSGLTDKEIAEMTVYFREHTLEQIGRFHVVEPSIVVEIAFDVIHRSNRHDSGFALRFPRIFRLRPDKDAREIDTLSNVEVLFRRLESGRRIQRTDAYRCRAARMSTDDDSKVSRLRELLPATSAGIYLDTATFGPLPAETAAAMREADDWELKVGRATVGRVEDVEQRVEEARAVLAALLVADPSEVVLTPGVDAAFELAGRLTNGRDVTILDASYLAGAQHLEASALGAEFVAFALRQVAAWAGADGGPLGQPPCRRVGRGHRSNVGSIPDSGSRAGAQCGLDRDVCRSGLGVCAHGRSCGPTA